MHGSLWATKVQVPAAVYAYECFWFKVFIGRESIVIEDTVSTVCLFFVKSINERLLQRNSNIRTKRGYKAKSLCR